MILKNFINYFNIIQISFYFVYLYIVNKFLVTLNIRNKFFLFIVNYFILIGIGLYYSLDGLMMLFFVCELTIILVFVILFSQLYSYYKETNSSYIVLFFSLSILLLNCNYYNLDIVSFKNFYSYSNILVNDFYYIYNLYFEKQILLTIFSLFIITIYSIFFILLYYNLRFFSLKSVKIKKKIFLLRKQNLVHQNNYNTKIRLFKTKN